jgi:hypothetical protein
MWASGHSAATVKRAAHGHEPTRRGGDGGVRQELAAGVTRVSGLTPYLHRVNEPGSLGQLDAKVA